MLHEDTLPKSWAARNVSTWIYHPNIWVNGLNVETDVTQFQGVVFLLNIIGEMGYKTVVAVNPLANKPEAFTQLARLMSRSWVSFINDVDPNNSAG
jgi:hypothetical protein